MYILYSIVGPKTELVSTFCSHIQTEVINMFYNTSKTKSDWLIKCIFWFYFVELISAFPLLSLTTGIRTKNSEQSYMWLTSLESRE